MFFVLFLFFAMFIYDIDRSWMGIYIFVTFQIELQLISLTIKNILKNNWSDGMCGLSFV